MTSLPIKRHGHPLILGENLNEKAPLYLNIREGVVAESIVMVVLVLSCYLPNNPCLLNLAVTMKNKNLAYLLLIICILSREKLQLKKNYLIPKDFAEIRKQF